MANCPLCESQVPDDFGLIECGSCGAQLIVHMDGRVEYSGAKPKDGSEVTGVEEFKESSVHEQPKEDSLIGSVTEFKEEPKFEPEINDPDPTMIIVDPTPRNDGSPDLSDIARFGNSGVSSGGDGSLRYNLVITGIDTADVREDFREAIMDRKLMWDIDQILRSVRHGEVRIANVPAAKAFVVISRLRNLPVQVRWEQYAIAQTS